MSAINFSIICKYYEAYVELLIVQQVRIQCLFLLKFILFLASRRSKIITDTDDDLLDMTTFNKNNPFYQDDSEDDPLLGERSFHGNPLELMCQSLCVVIVCAHYILYS